MKQTIINSTLNLVLIALMATFIACDKEKTTIPAPTPATKSLYVKFMNDPRSIVTITYISIRHMGAVQTSKSSTQNQDEPWSNNLLSNGTTIAPGGHQFFTLDIEAGNYAEYRLGVDRGDGTQIMLFEQTGTWDNYPPITHWGGDDRTVYVSIYKNDANGLYYISGWGDSVGIMP